MNSLQTFAELSFGGPASHVLDEMGDGPRPVVPVKRHHERRHDDLQIHFLHELDRGSLPVRTELSVMEQHMVTWNHPGKSVHQVLGTTLMGVVTVKEKRIDVGDLRK